MVVLEWGAPPSQKKFLPYGFTLPPSGAIYGFVFNKEGYRNGECTMRSTGSFAGMRARGRRLKCAATGSWFVFRERGKRAPKDNGLPSRNGTERKPQVIYV